MTASLRLWLWWDVTMTANKRCHKRYHYDHQQKLTCQTDHIWGSAWSETPRGCHPRCWPVKATATMSTWFKRRLWLGCQNTFMRKCRSCVICKKKFFSYLFWGQTACGIYLSRMVGGENNRRWKLGRVMAKLWRILHSLLSIFFSSHRQCCHHSSIKYYDLKQKYSPSFCRSWKKKNTIKHFLKSLNFLLSLAVKSDGFSK